MEAIQPSLDVYTCRLTPVNGVGYLEADDLTWCYHILVALEEISVRTNQIAQNLFRFLVMCSIILFAKISHVIKPRNLKEELSKTRDMDPSMQPLV